MDNKPTKMTITTDQATYTVTTDVLTRMAEGPGGNLIPTNSVQYNILLDGVMVRFCFDEERIEEMIAIHEGRGNAPHPIYFTGRTSG
jgi:hypothetical protein